MTHLCRVGHRLLPEIPAEQWEAPPRSSNCHPRGLHRLQAEPMVRVALDYIVDDEEAPLRVLCGNGAQVQPLEERSHERT